MSAARAQPSPITAAGSLERSYRRLLAWYPASHRTAHGDEMLGVLLARADDGQRRPAPADAINLLWGSLRIRIRPRGTEPGEHPWRDALAVFSVAAPLILLAQSLAIVFGRDIWIWMLSLSEFPREPVSALTLWLICAQAIFAGLVLVRWPRAAAFRASAVVLAAGVAVLFALDSAQGVMQGVIGPAFVNALVVVEVVALLASPGPKRGRQIMKVRHWVLLAAAAAGVSLIRGIGPLLAFTPGYYSAASAIAAGALCLIAIVLWLSSPLGQRVLLLFAIPAYGFAYRAAGLGSTDTYLTLAISYLPPLLLASLLVVVARRSGRPGSPADLDLDA